MAFSIIKIVKINIQKAPINPDSKKSDLTPFEKWQIRVEKGRMFIGLFTFLAVAGTLGCYIKLGFMQHTANILNSQYVGISRDSFVNSVMPWVDVKTGSVDIDANNNVEVGLVLENHSNYPAQYVEVKCRAVDEMQNQERSTSFMPPQSELNVIFESIKGNPRITYDSIKNGNTILIITIKCMSIEGDWITTTENAKMVNGEIKSFGGRVSVDRHLPGSTNIQTGTSYK